MKLDRNRLRQAREMLGYGLEKTAQEAGISKNSVLRAEHEEDIRPVTARKIAAALDVDVADLLEGGWWQAFENSQRFRAAAKERLGARLSLWEVTRNEGASDEKQRRLLDEVGLVLDEATETLRKLQENLSEGLDHTAERSPGGTDNPYWEEVRAADTIYRELREMVRNARLSVRPRKASDKVRLNQHELEALTA